MGRSDVSAASAPTWFGEMPAEMRPSEDGGSRLVGQLPDGIPITAEPLIVGSPRQAGELAAHLRFLGTLSDPHLVPLRGAAHDRSTVWALSQREDGVTLAELLEGADLSPAQATAIGIDILSGLVALRRAGFSHGSLHADSVHIGHDGLARLSDYALRPRWREDADLPVWPDLRGDLVAAGTLLCAALGIAREAPAGELSELERMAPGLAVAARAMARGGYGSNVRAALAAVRAAAGGLADPDILRLARRELAGAAPAVEAPTPPPPAEPAAGQAPAETVAPVRPGGRPLRWVAVVLAGAFAVGLAVGAWHRPDSAPLAGAGRQAPSSAPPASPAPTAQPDLGAAPPAQPPPAPPTPEVAGPRTATDAVADFYQLVGQHQFGGAVQLWSDHMKAAYPPGENIDQRFTDTSSLQLLRNDLSSSDDGRAVVTVDLVEVRAGRTYHWVGAWYLVHGSTGWLLDQPALRSA